MPDHIQVKVLGDDKFRRKLQQISKEQFATMREEVISIANDVRNEAILSMRKTKRNLSKPTSRQFTRSGSGTRKGKLFHYPSLPGNPPAIDTGGLVGDIKVDAGFDEIEVGAATKKYAKFLEEGTRTMEARPWLQPAFESIPVEQRLREKFRKVVGKGV